MTKNCPTARGPLVYMATNVVNGKRYIGVTKNLLSARRRCHLWMAKRGIVDGRAFHAAIRKYGADVFEWSVLSFHSDYQGALDAERVAIADLRPEYNIAPGGTYGVVGLVKTLEWKARISAANKGKKRSASEIQRMRAFRHSTETKEALRRMFSGRPGHMLGKHHTEETKERISAAKKRWCAENSEKALAAALKASPARKRRVLFVETGEVFSGVREAVRRTGIGKDTIILACKHHATRTRKHARKFRYLEEVEAANGAG